MRVTQGLTGPLGQVVQPGSAMRSITLGMGEGKAGMENLRDVQTLLGQPGKETDVGVGRAHPDAVSDTCNCGCRRNQTLHSPEENSHGSHGLGLIKLNIIAAALTQAWQITGENL